MVQTDIFYGPGIPIAFRRKKKVYGHWKQGQATQEDYKGAVCHCSEKIHRAKAQLESVSL